MSWKERVCVYVLEFVVYSLLVFFFPLFLFCQFDFFVVVERDRETVRVELGKKLMCVCVVCV